MEEQNSEIIVGEKVLEILREWIDTRQICRLKIPNTSHGGITVLLGFRKKNGVPCLIIDNIPTFDQILPRYLNHEIEIEFLEKKGILCSFQTKLLESQLKYVLTTIPEVIFRFQRRKYFRVNARSGTRVIFQIKKGESRSANVKDYGVGGVAFFIDPTTELLKEEDILTNINLKIPFLDRKLNFYISKGVVKRREPESSGKFICAVEFLEMLEPTREKLWHHILEEQRLQIRRMKRID